MQQGYGRREAVEHLLAMGANVLARDDGGLIPLHNACSFGHAEVVALLLQAGADPNAKDSWSYTPLHEAAVKGKIDVCIMLLQHGADPSIRNSVSSLFCFLNLDTANCMFLGQIAVCKMF